MFTNADNELINYNSFYRSLSKRIHNVAYTHNWNAEVET